MNAKNITKKILENMNYDGRLFTFEDAEDLLDYCDGFINITEEQAKELLNDVNTEIQDEIDYGTCISEQYNTYYSDRL